MTALRVPCGNQVDGLPPASSLYKPYYPKEMSGNNWKGRGFLPKRRAIPKQYISGPEGAAACTCAGPWESSF